MAKITSGNRIVIEPGDTLYSIYGPNWKQLSGYKGDPSKLPVGTTLPAPAGFSGSQSNTPVKQTQSTASSSSGAYDPNWRQKALDEGKDVNAPEFASMKTMEASGGGSPIDQVNKMIQDSFQSLQNEVVKRFGEYKAGKPFRVDEVLAEKTKEASEQIDPYYNELLGDYMLGVTRKLSRGVDDTKALLDELTASTTSYTKETQNVLETALDEASQGFAETGLFGSGEALKTEGQLKQKTGGALDEYMRKAGAQESQAKTNLTRNIEDINLGKKTFVSDLERERYTETQNRASQLTKEAGQQYTQGFQATLPTELQSASGFDMLKSLGIYS